MLSLSPPLFLLFAKDCLSASRQARGRNRLFQAGITAWTIHVG
jgi:hypothetical protein